LGLVRTGRQGNNDQKKKQKQGHKGEDVEIRRKEKKIYGGRRKIFLSHRESLKLVRLMLQVVKTTPLRRKRAGSRTFENSGIKKGDK